MVFFMAVISMKQLLEAGVHFGHQTRRWNPKMAEYIFTERNGIYIIDLQKTVKKIDEAYYFLRDVIANGDDLLFVGTKKQAQETVQEEANRCGMPFVTNRWLGGMLTNLLTIRKSVRKYKKILDQKEKGIFEKLPTKEVSKLNKELTKLEESLGGILEMSKAPDAIFVVDTIKEDIAIKEARRLNIPVVAVVDTNSNPKVVDVPIPGNDDAIRAIKLIVATMANACLDGEKIYIEKTGGTYEEISDDNEKEELVAAIEKEEMIEEVEAVKE